MSLIQKNVIMTAGVVAANILAFVFHFIAGRLLGPEEYGEFGALIATVMVIGLPLSALSSTVTKFISRANASDPKAIRKLKQRFQIDALAIGGLILIGVMIFRNTISDYLKLDRPGVLILIAFTGLFSLLLGISRGVALGVRNYTQYSWNLIIESFMRLLALFALVYLGIGATGALGSYCIAYLISFVILELTHNKRFTHKESASFSRKELYRFMGVMLAVQFAIRGSINLPTLYIKHEYSNEFTGYWNAALTISRTILFVTAAVSMVLFTETSSNNPRSSTRRNLIISSTLVFCSSGLIALVYFLFPEFFLRLLFGEKFIDAAPILQWMGFSMIGFGLIDLWSKYYLAKMK